MGFWGSVKNVLLGGDATKNFDNKLNHYDSATAQLGQMATDAQGRQAPMAQAAQLGAPYQMQTHQLAPGQMDQSRGGLMGVANRLGAVASGQQAGAGELAVNRQFGQGASALQSAARSAHGANAALAYRNAMRATADMGLGAAGQAAQAQMQDQANANQQLGSIYGGMYGQDANVAAQNAQLGQAAGAMNAQLGQQAMLQQGQFNQQTALANQGAALQQRSMNDAMQIQALGQQLGWDQARINAEIAKANVAANDKGILPGLIGAAGTAAAAYATGGASAAAGMGQGSQGGGGAAIPQGPVTSPRYDDPLGPYRRPEF